MNFTIGSLFDGSGGFPLAASMCGGTPIWAAEIEPYPIAVTTSRFPNMKHLGSVTEVKGNEVEPVDVLCFGAPCQDLSVAGLRKGLRHDSLGDGETTRSGLFMEAVRIIKEMREATNGRYPKLAIYENVPGAFSSSGGQDFRIVLEELIKIAEPSAVMPEVPKGGWPYADSYCGEGWSLSYRVFDAQCWGVPQRRRRIYLVADFRGECARKVLFEREGLRGYFETGRTPWETATGDAEGSFGTADCERNCVALEPGIAAREGGHIYEGVSGTLRANAGDNRMSVAYSFDALSSNSMKSSNPHSGCRQVDVAKCLDTTDPNPSKNQGGIAIVEQVPYTLKIRSGCDVDAKGKAAGKGALIQTNKASTLAVAQDQYLFQPVVCHKDQHLFENHSQDSRYKGPLDVCPMLPAQLGTGGNNQPFVVESQPTCSYNIGDRFDVPREHGEQTPTLTARMGTGGNNVPAVVEGKTVYCLQGAGATSQASHGMGHTTDTSYTLNTTDVHGVAFQTYQKVTDPLMANSHPGSYTGQDAFSDMLVAGVDARNATEYPEMTGALQADAAHNLNSNNVVRIQYIVRRLTPTECARLQGFPDKWGHPDVKTELTDEEYQFWLNVRNTHAAINDKPTKEYTKEQILKWYNALHTDSSEYKMWGNGIALPNALYVMQGIADMMSEEKASRRKWLDDLLGDCI